MNRPISDEQRYRLAMRGQRRWAQKSEAAKARIVQRLREGARAYWDSAAGLEKRQELSEKNKANSAQRWETFAANNPERAALIQSTTAALEEGSLQRQPCDRCGGEGKPVYDYEAGCVAGWRCYLCRKEVR